jgi:hypothetical protein
MNVRWNCGSMPRAGLLRVLLARLLLLLARVVARTRRR